MSSLFLSIFMFLFPCLLIVNPKYSSLCSQFKFFVHRTSFVALARLWTFSSTSISFLKYGAQTWIQYSRWGRMYIVITETLWSSTSFKTIMVSLHRGRFVVMHRRWSFPIDPKNFSWGQIFLTKSTIFGDFWSRTATFLKLQRWNLACGCGLGAPYPLKAKFCKNDLRGYTPLGQIYTKNYHFWRFFWAVSPHLLSQNGKNLAWECEPERPSPMPNLQKLVGV